jgi:hypothetical protein
MGSGFLALPQARRDTLFPSHASVDARFRYISNEVGLRQEFVFLIW